MLAAFAPFGFLGRYCHYSPSGGILAVVARFQTDLIGYLDYLGAVCDYQLQNHHGPYGPSSPCFPFELS